MLYFGNPLLYLQMYDRFGDPRYFVSYNGGNPMTVAWMPPSNLYIHALD